MVRNEDIWGKVEVTSMADKIWEAGLRWFGMERGDALVRRCGRLTLKGLRRGRGRLKKY